MVQGLRLGARLGVLSGARGSVLGGLVPGGGAGGLGLVDGSRVVGERLGGIDSLLGPLGPLALYRELGPSGGAHGLGVAPGLTDHPAPALQHGVHLSGVGGHGLYDLLLAVLLGVVLQVGLGVGRGHQRGACSRGCRLQHGGGRGAVVGPGGHHRAFGSGVFSLVDGRHVLVHLGGLYRVDLGHVGKVGGVVEGPLAPGMLEDH